MYIAVLPSIKQRLGYFLTSLNPLLSHDAISMLVLSRDKIMVDWPWRQFTFSLKCIYVQERERLIS